MLICCRGAGLLCLHCHCCCYSLQVCWAAAEDICTETAGVLLSVVLSCFDLTCGISFFVLIHTFVLLYVREFKESVFIFFVIGYSLVFLSLSLSRCCSGYSLIPDLFLLSSSFISSLMFTQTLRVEGKFVKLCFLSPEGFWVQHYELKGV